MSRHENHKAVGEKGVLCVLAEFAKYDIPVSIPFSDNLPYDFIADVNGKLFRIQVKSSSYSDTNGSISFYITTNNWYSKTTKKYNQSDCDVIVCYDLNNSYTYLLTPSQFVDRKSVTIRQQPAKNNQNKGCNLHENFIISSHRIREVFV